MNNMNQVGNNAGNAVGTDWDALVASTSAQLGLTNPNGSDDIYNHLKSKLDDDQRERAAADAESGKSPERLAKEEHIEPAAGKVAIEAASGEASPDVATVNANVSAQEREDSVDEDVYIRSAVATKFIDFLKSIRDKIKGAHPREMQHAVFEKANPDVDKAAAPEVNADKGNDPEIINELVEVSDKPDPEVIQQQLQAETEAEQPDYLDHDKIMASMERGARPMRVEESDRGRFVDFLNQQLKDGTMNYNQVRTAYWRSGLKNAWFDSERIFDKPADHPGTGIVESEREVPVEHTGEAFDQQPSGDVKALKEITEILKQNISEGKMSEADLNDTIAIYKEFRDELANKVGSSKLGLEEASLTDGQIEHEQARKKLDKLQADRPVNPNLADAKLRDMVEESNRQREAEAIGFSDRVKEAEKLINDWRYRKGQMSHDDFVKEIGPEYADLFDAQPDAPIELTAKGKEKLYAYAVHFDPEQNLKFNWYNAKPPKTNGRGNRAQRRHQSATPQHPVVPRSDKAATLSSEEVGLAA